MRKTLTIVFMWLGVAHTQAQTKQTVLDYIERYKQIAIDEMVRAKIPASITLAQGILESGAGTSVLCKNSNNHFGIKCKENWSGKRYYHDDDRPQECFRVYTDPRDSYVDHSEFLLTRQWYAPLFQLPITSYKYWALGLKEAGYATNPKYAPMLIDYIEQYNLAQYDQIGVAKIEEKEKMMKQPEQGEPLQARAQSRIAVTEAKHKEQHKKELIKEAGRAEYMVNGLRAIKAEGNEDPLKVAMEYHIDYAFVMQFNDLATGERFKPGQFIFLQPKKHKAGESTYIVLPGESMHDISQKTGVKLSVLYSKNLMKPNEQAYAGEPLNMQDKKTAPPRVMSYEDFLRAQRKASQSKGEPAEKTASTHNTVAALTQNKIEITAAEYQVQPTDTLYSIARKFNTSVDELKQINNLENTDLKAGQTLMVSK